MIVINDKAPDWAKELARKIDDAIQQSRFQPVYMQSYLVAGLPDVVRWTNCAIIVSNEAGGRTIATSDGTNWRRVSDGNVVS